MYEADPRYQYHDDGRDINGSYGDTEEGGLTYFSADGKKVEVPLNVYVTQTQGGQAAKLAKVVVGGGLNFKSTTGKYNNSQYAGLENVLANSYLNPLIMSLYFETCSELLYWVPQSPWIHA